MPSLRKAIDATCRSCIYDPMAGGKWREQVTACASSCCPLHPVRPQTTAKSHGEAAKHSLEAPGHHRTIDQAKVEPKIGQIGASE